MRSIEKGNSANLEREFGGRPDSVRFVDFGNVEFWESTTEDPLCLFGAESESFGENGGDESVAVARGVDSGEGREGEGSEEDVPRCCEDLLS